MLADHNRTTLLAAFALAPVSLPQALEGQDTPGHHATTEVALLYAESLARCEVLISEDPRLDAIYQGIHRNEKGIHHQQATDLVRDMFDISPEQGIGVKDSRIYVFLQALGQQLCQELQESESSPEIALVSLETLLDKVANREADAFKAMKALREKHPELPFIELLSSTCFEAFQLRLNSLRTEDTQTPQIFDLLERDRTLLRLYHRVATLPPPSGSDTTERLVTELFLSVHDGACQRYSQGWNQHGDMPFERHIIPSLSLIATLGSQHHANTSAACILLSDVAQSALEACTRFQHDTFPREVLCAALRGLQNLSENCPGEMRSHIEDATLSLAGETLAQQPNSGVVLLDTLTVLQNHPEKLLDFEEILITHLQNSVTGKLPELNPGETGAKILDAMCRAHFLQRDPEAYKALQDRVTAFLKKEEHPLEEGGNRGLHYFSQRSSFTFKSYDMRFDLSASHHKK